MPHFEKLVVKIFSIALLKIIVFNQFNIKHPNALTHSLIFQHLIFSFAKELLLLFQNGQDH